MIRLELSNTPCLHFETQTVPLERKIAGILTWLAYAGAQPRARVAAVFWADAESGRNNLRQALFKLRNFELFITTEPLTLNPNLEIAQSTVLLEGMDFSDCPIFEEWLITSRALAENQQLTTIEKSLQHLMQIGDLKVALQTSREWLTLEPFSEEALRQHLQLLAQQGEFALVLSAYQTFKERLQLEWNLVPSRATQDFIAILEQEAGLHWQKMAVQLELNADFVAAAQAWQKAGELLKKHQPEQALTAFLAAHHLLLEFADAQALEAITLEIEGLAKHPSDLAKAALARAKTSFAAFEFELAVRAARVGLRVGVKTMVGVQLENELASALLRLDRIPEALQAHQRALQTLRLSLDQPELLAQTLADLALAEANADMHPQAQNHFLEADQLYSQLGMARERISILGNLAMSQRIQGNSETALETLMLAETIAKGSQGITDELRYLLANRGEVLLWREEYSAALEALLEAKRLSGQMPMSFIWFRLAHLYTQTNNFTAALEAVQNAETSAGVLERGRGMAWLIRARILRLQGLDATQPLEQAKKYLEKSSAPSYRLRFCLEVLAHQTNPRLARATLKEIKTLGLNALLPLALIRLGGKTNLQRAWKSTQLITPMDISQAQIAKICLQNDLKLEGLAN
jgi:DNA-binding SARP family transcriptional activator